MKKTIYLSGLPRAMTTLMANILANNPRIVGGETSPLLEYLYGARANYSTTPEVKSALDDETMYKSFISFCKSGIEGYSNSMCGEKYDIYLDKSRGWVYYSEFLKEIQPDAKIIVMVRDIRSIVSSFEKKWRDNPSILDGRDIPAKQQFITVDQRVNHWLNEPPLGIALKRIYNAWQTQTLKNMLVIRAEELCKKPKEVMEKVYQYLGEPYYDMDYNNVKQMTIENDRISDFGIYGDHRIREKVEPLKKDYDEMLTPQVASSIKSGFKWFYDAFDYF